MDAVEVPSVEQIRTRRRHSSDPAGLAPGADVESVPEPATEAPKQTIRRTRSATKLLGKEADFQRLETPKRRRTTRAAELREEAAGMSSPLRGLLSAPQFGSGEYCTSSVKPPFAAHHPRSYLLQMILSWLHRPPSRSQTCPPLMMTRILAR